MEKFGSTTILTTTDFFIGIVISHNIHWNILYLKYFFRAEDRPIMFSRTCRPGHRLKSGFTFPIYTTDIQRVRYGRECEIEKFLI